MKSISDLNLQENAIPTMAAYVESRTHDILSDYFFKISLEERKKVEYICTDIRFVFKPLLKTYFLNSILPVGKWSIINTL